MIGKPGDLERKCPKCEQWGTFRVIYARSNNRYVNIGRKCIDDLEHPKGGYSWYREDKKKGCGYFKKTITD